MGGEGPYVRFNSSYRSTRWADRTGLTNLNDAELEAAYSRAKEVLMEKKRELVDVHNWSVQPEDDSNTTLFSLTGKIVNSYGRYRDVQLRLPLSFASFLDEAKNEMWTRMFENSQLFDAKRQNKENSTLFIDSLTSISDVFYLLQILAPGMLLIIRVDEIDEAGEIETARALPSAEWVKDHESILQHVLGSEQRYQSLAAVAADDSKSFQTDWISSYPLYDDSDRDFYTNPWGVREPLDYTACDSDCGFCGGCEY
jgi:hypothetical protein